MPLMRGRAQEFGFQGLARGEGRRGKRAGWAMRSFRGSTGATVLESPSTRLLSNARITAIGTYVPQKAVTNDDLSRQVDTSDSWILQRTGIRERRMSSDDEFTSDLCCAAIENLAGRWKCDLSDVDYLLVATSTPDYALPSVASQVQHRLGLAGSGALDVNATCAGFIYALQLANALITAGAHRKILVVGAEVLTKVVNFEDRTTCILFGDGAGAVLVERNEEQGSFLASHCGSDGGAGRFLYRSGLSKTIAGEAMTGDGDITQRGRDVFKWVLQNIPGEISKLLSKAGLTTEQVDWFIPHSANLRIVEALCEKTGLPMSKTLESLTYYGNTSSATIPLAIDRALRDDKQLDNKNLLLYGFGGGLVHAGVIVRWRPLG